MAKNKYAGGGKVDHAKRVAAMMKGMGNRFSRQRLERILDENPDAVPYIHPLQMLYLARSENPLASLAPEEFLTLASKQGWEGEDAAPGILRRSKGVLKALRRGEQMSTSPELVYQFGGSNPFEQTGPLVIIGHDGRARSTALGELGVKNVPVELKADIEFGESRRKRARDINRVERIENEDTDRDDVVDIKDRAFAEGGQVLPSSTDDEEPWTDTYLKRPLSGLAAMWGASDPETGEYVNPAWHNIKRVLRSDARRKAGLPREEMAVPGVVDETLSLPALGGLVGLPVPEFAEKASEGADATRGAAREAFGLDAPHGFTENLTESAGVMAGQMPVPASMAKKLKMLKEGGSKLAKIAGPAVEWFSPTVVPKASNYLQGTMFGGILGGGLDYLEDRLSEKEREKRNKQIMAEAMAEVLEEERQGSGGEESDDEALAELGYAEGGRVKTAKRTIGSLRQLLSETDQEDVASRKAAIDNALLSLRGTAGIDPNDRMHLSTLSGGLADAAATEVPVRRKQRFGDYESNILKLLENKIAPGLTDAPTATVDLPPVVSNMPPPPAVRTDAELVPPAWGDWNPDEFNRKILKQEYATGGKVTNNPWNAPQVQKDPTAQPDPAANPANPTGDPRGAPLSTEWFENYGEGPEHLFLGDRTIKLHDMWGPQHPGAVPNTQQQPDGSWLPAAGILGFSLYDEWKKKRGAGDDASQQAFWADMQQSAANTTDTDAWVNQQLQNYGDYASMPQMNADGSISYVQPNQFWRGIHDSAANTTNTDAWVNQQLDDYGQGMLMPHMNDDGTISYTDQNGKAVDPSRGWDSRALQGASGAYGLYSGLDQGGVEGYVQAYQGANDLYNAYSGSNLSGAGTLGGLGSIYSGINQGGVQGYTQAAGGAAQLASTAGYGGAATGVIGKAVPIVGALYSAYGAYESAKVGDKKSAVAQGAAAGAAIGSVVPVIGTAVGAVIGAIVGLAGASLGNKENPSEIAYGAHKKLASDQQIRGWSADQVGGAVFETIKSHTKSGNVNKFPDVAEMYTAFGITKDAHKNYKNVQQQMGDFIDGTIKTAQQMGALPTDPYELRQLDGQQIYYKVVVPALAAKYKETTGKDSTAWSTDSITAGSDSKLQALFADWTDWKTSHWDGTDGRNDVNIQATKMGLNDPVRSMAAVERAEGGLVGVY